MELQICSEYLPRRFIFVAENQAHFLADRVGFCNVTVGTLRRRFAELWLEGLSDLPRSRRRFWYFNGSIADATKRSRPIREAPANTDAG